MNELPPEDALAFSLHHTKGEYALLVGSGLSTAAGIPTGWKITIYLVQKLKWCDGHSEEASPSSENELISWLDKKYKKYPDYSDLIGLVAPSKEERKKFLKKHIEGDGPEPIQPTIAHRKIAQLVKAGKIKVIITTNFDRLLERALSEEGINSLNIANDDDIKGAEPLVHSSCTLVKVHGDYLDTRIKNTSQELAKYSPKLNKYLDRIFDDFGLIVVGWSADSDQALVDAIMRAPNRRYSFYWAAHEGKTGTNAQDIIEKRKGRVIDIKSADDFFITLADKVEGLDRLQAPHPVSVSAALGLARKYCRDDQYAMEWAELLHAEVEKVRDFVTGSDFPFNANDKDRTLSNEDKLKNLAEIFIVKTEILRRAALICGRWGTDKASLQIIEVIRSLAFEDQKYPDNIETKKFGASLIFYWFLSSLIEAKKWRLASQLMRYDIENYKGEYQAMVYVMPPQSWSGNIGFLNPKSSNNKSLVQNWFFENLKKELKDISLSSIHIDELIIKTEIYICLEYIIARHEIYFSNPQNAHKINEIKYYNHPLFIYKLKLSSSLFVKQMTHLNEEITQKDLFQSGWFYGSKTLFDKAINILTELTPNPAQNF